MSVIDILIIGILVFGAFSGFKYGLVRSAVSLVGSLLIVVGAYYLKNPLSVLMYENLPFRTFGGIFSGITSINIIVYEAISYLICLVLLFILLRLIIKLTGILDKLIKATIILAIPSKIIGALLKFVEYYIYTFLILFICASIPFFTPYFKDSKVATKIVSDTPILSKTTDDAYNSVMDIYEICLKYQFKDNKKDGDYEALETLLKYDIISTESVKKLNEKKKLKIDNIDELIKKYEKRDKNDKVS